MYQPTIAASTATIVPASSALTMNGNVSSSRRSVIGLSVSVGFIRVVRGVRSPWWWGASGWPTTTRRPSAVLRTSIGVPYSSLSLGAVMTSSTEPLVARPPAM